MIKSLKGFLRKRITKPERLYPDLFVREPRQIIMLPSFKNPRKINIKYPLLEPLVYANIKWVPSKRNLVYNVIEPKLTPEEKKTLKDIENGVTEIIDIKISVIKNKEEVVSYLHKKVKNVIEDMSLNLDDKSYMKIMYFIIRDFIGLNEVEPLMHDPYIEDIGCTGWESPIYVIHRKFGSIETGIVYEDPEYLSNFIVKLSERCGRYISYAKPLLDGSLPDGSRVQASLAKDVTTRGPTFSIRKFRRNPYSPIDMLNLKTVSPSLMAYLWFLVQNEVSILVCGGTSTGKTTFLNALSMFIPPEDKIISIEDTRELHIPHENWIPSVSRAGFGVPDAGGKRYGEVDLFDLLRESFRMNPDYVIVGEVRGREAYVMFQGISSGHPSLGTIHAGSVDDVVKRLETPPIELSPSLIESLDALIVMVNAKEKGKSARRVKEIVEIQSVDSHTGKAHTIKTFGWIPSTDGFKENTSESEVLRRISFERGISYQGVIKELERRKKILEWMQKHDIMQYDDFYGLVNLYYKNPKTVMRWVEKDTDPRGKGLKRAARKRGETATGLKIISD
jgi:flagellar protein FlaI